MTIAEVLEAKRREIGIPMAEVSRRVSMNYDVLTRCFHGDSMPKGDQFVRICRELGLDISDFPDDEGEEG